MTTLAFDFIVSMIALSVMLALMMVTSSAPRMLRIGIAVATSMVVASASLSLLALTGEPLSSPILDQYMQSLKVLAISWAAYDVARIAMRIGTLDIVRASDAARGFLLSDPATRSVWNAWAAAVPVPAWVKAASGEMLAVNSSYESRYGKAEHAYVGGADISVWDPAIAEGYKGHDRLVLESRKAHVFTEPAPIWHNDKRSSKFLKFPVVNGKGELVAIGGLEVGDADGADSASRWNDAVHPHRRKSDRGSE